MIVALLLVFSAAEAPSPAELIAAYDRSRQVFEHVEYRVRYEETYQGPSERLNGQVSRDGTYDVRHQGERWWVKRQEHARSPSNSLEVRTVREKTLNDVGAFIDASRGEDRSDEDYVSGRLDGESEQVRAANHLMPLHGYLEWFDEKPLTQVLEASDLAVSQDSSVAGSVWKLDSRGRYGHTEMWFDGALRVLRIRRVAEGDDFVNSWQVSALPPTDDAWRPKGKQVQFENIVEMRWADSGNVSYPEEFAITTIEHSASGQTASWRFEGRIEQFAHAPSFAQDDFAMTIIPDGTRIYVEDSNLDYEWRDGQLNKIVSTSAESRLAAARFRSRFSAATYFVVFGVLLITATLIGRWVYRRAAG